MDSDLIAVLNIPSKDRTEHQLDFIETHTSHIKFFNELREQGAHLHRACCELMILEHFHAGQEIFQFGATGDKFYILLKGTVSISIPVSTKVALNDSNLEATLHALAQRAYPAAEPAAVLAALR